MADKNAASSSARLRHPQTRAGRLAAIRTAIESTAITSQQQLSEILAEQGFEVTQATLSRDLDELEAFKARNSKAIMSYMLPDSFDAPVVSADAVETESGDEPDSVATSARIRPQMTKVLSGLVTSVATASNQVVIHTPSGAAQYVASVIDAEPPESVLGTIAGDDTVLTILSSEATAQKYSSQLLKIASGQNPAS
ncbi:MAG: arginine repressor [Bifidobacteriaceae bacterium]|nr:arginine repressor [Bifidobacteriaceae bacterium]MCI1914758.1 arginine repressor [Bifidobacteriaceae bacterium]